MSFWKTLVRILRPRMVDPKTGPQTYAALRQQILELTPEKLGTTNAPQGQFLGLLMETGYEKAVVTLIVLRDETVSLYFSNGGGMLGLGGVEGPRAAGVRLLEKAEGYVSAFKPAAVPPPPALKMTQFVAITQDGTLVASALEAELAKDMNPLSPLFHAGHEVITQARLHSEKRRL